MRLLQAHNTIRRAHQVCDLKFSTEAAEAAQEFSERMDIAGKLLKSSDEERNGCGENIYSFKDK